MPTSVQPSIIQTIKEILLIHCTTSKRNEWDDEEKVIHFIQSSIHKRKTKGYLTEKYLFTYYFLIITLLFFHPSILRLAYSQKVTFLSLLFALLLNERMQKFEWFHISVRKIIMKRWSIILEPIKINCMWSVSFSLRWCQRETMMVKHDVQCVPITYESMNGFCNLILMYMSFNGQCIDNSLEIHYFGLNFYDGTGYSFRWMSKTEMIG